MRKVCPFITLLAVVFRAVTASDNGRATTPPAGWRSWNQYQGRINQGIMESNMRALASRNRKGGLSLAELGYTDAGLDDGWQLCNQHPNPADPHAFHTPLGAPVVDTTIFPDFAAMNRLAHSLNLTSGWYGNNCNCGPTPRNGCSEGDHNGCTGLECYAGDVNATIALGFDSMKLDGCGGQRDIALWSMMFNHSIRTWNAQHPDEPQKLPMMLENCHDGMDTKPPPGATPPKNNPDWGAVGITPYYDAKGELWCPFHTYRSGGDNRHVSVLHELSFHCSGLH